MAKMMNIEGLRRALRMRVSELSKLQSRRARIAAKLAKMDRRIQALSGETTVAKTRGSKRPTPASKDGRRTPRPRRGSKPLVEWVKDALGKSTKPIRVKEVTQVVRAAGYKTASKDFYGIVATTLRDAKNFKKVSRGVYKLA